MFLAVEFLRQLRFIKPSLNEDSARAKVKAAENARNTRDPKRVAFAVLDN